MNDASMFTVDEKASNLLSNVLDNIMLSEGGSGSGSGGVGGTQERGGLKKIYNNLYKTNSSTSQDEQVRVS